MGGLVVGNVEKGPYRVKKGEIVWSKGSWIEDNHESDNCPKSGVVMQLEC